MSDQLLVQLARGVDQAWDGAVVFNKVGMERVEFGFEGLDVLLHTQSLVVLTLLLKLCRLSLNLLDPVTSLPKGEENLSQIN